MAKSAKAKKSTRKKPTARARKGVGRKSTLKKKPRKGAPAGKKTPTKKPTKTKGRARPRKSARRYAVHALPEWIEGTFGYENHEVDGRPGIWTNDPEPQFIAFERLVNSDKFIGVSLQSNGASAEQVAKALASYLEDVADGASVTGVTCCDGTPP
jgi:hypothetical protein